MFNLTDVPTKVLEQRRLVNQHFAVGQRMLAPGEYVDVEDKDGVLFSRLKGLLTVSAISVDQVPPAYAKAKQTQTGHLGTIPVRHVTMNETKVAGVSVAPDVHAAAAVPVTKFDPLGATERPPSEVAVEEVIPEPVTQQSRGSKRKQGR